MHGRGAESSRSCVGALALLVGGGLKSTVVIPRYSAVPFRVTTQFSAVKSLVATSSCRLICIAFSQDGSRSHFSAGIATCQGTALYHDYMAEAMSTKQVNETTAQQRVHLSRLGEASPSLESQFIWQLANAYIPLNSCVSNSLYPSFS